MKLSLKAACLPLVLRNGLVSLFLLFLVQAMHANAPIDLAKLEEAGFTKQRWQKLKDHERAALYRAYAPDQEMLHRVRVGLIEQQPLEECISGEAPTIAELGVVVPKLKAVIAQSQKRDTAFKASESLLHIRIRNLLGIQPQLVQYAVVSEAQLRARKPRGLHHIPIRLPQRFDRNLEWQCQ